RSVEGLTGARRPGNETGRSLVRCARSSYRTTPSDHGAQVVVGGCEGSAWKALLEQFPPKAWVSEYTPPALSAVIATISSTVFLWSGCGARICVTSFSDTATASAPATPGAVPNNV